MAKYYINLTIFKIIFLNISIKSLKKLLYNTKEQGAWTKSDPQVKYGYDIPTNH